MSHLVVQDLSVAFGGVKAVDGVCFTAHAGKILSIIGPNGAGKTTVFNLVSGLYRPHRGCVRIEGEDVTSLPPHLLAARGLSRTFQNLQIFSRMSVAENVMVGRHLREHHSIISTLFQTPRGLRQSRETRAAALKNLVFVGLADFADRPAGSLPYGALKRLEIARALATEPKVLLLDEPAAGCNPVETEEIDRLIKAVAESGTAIVLVEHDMKLVMKISNRVLVLNAGRPLAEGAPQEVGSNPAVIEAYLGVQKVKERASA